MNILPELGEIAAAKYGLQLKDPIFRALDKLVQDPKFELVKNIIDDDYADFDRQMQYLFQDDRTGSTLREFLDAACILNGRKGFYSRVENPETEQNICYWINMLIEEIANAADDITQITLPFIGSGIVNGQRFRAAIYYILDILGSANAVSAEIVTCKFNTSCYIYGRDLSAITIHGNATGVGEQVIPGTGFYNVGFKLYDMSKRSWDTDYQLFIQPIGDEPLYEGDSYTITVPNTVDTSTRRIYKLELQHFTTDIEPTFKLTKEPIYESQDSDYRYITDDIMSSSTSLAYLNDKKRLVVPTSLGGQPLKTIGNTTFGYSDVNTVILQEGVETIE